MTQEGHRLDRANSENCKKSPTTKYHSSDAFQSLFLTSPVLFRTKAVPDLRLPFAGPAF